MTEQLEREHLIVAAANELFGIQMTGGDTPYELLDSLQMLELMTFLEEEHGLETDQALTIDDMRDVSTLAKNLRRAPG